LLAEYTQIEAAVAGPIPPFARAMVNLITNRAKAQVAPIP
jgi:hypothetical protein